jgi:hypothetical protein
MRAYVCGALAREGAINEVAQLCSLGELQHNAAAAAARCACDSSGRTAATATTAATAATAAGPLENSHALTVAPCAEAQLSLRARGGLHSRRMQATPTRRLGGRDELISRKRRGRGG